MFFYQICKMFSKRFVTEHLWLATSGCQYFRASYSSKKTRVFPFKEKNISNYLKVTKNVGSSTARFIILKGNLISGDLKPSKKVFLGKLSVFTTSQRFKSQSNIIKSKYAFSEFAKPCCKWGKVVRLLCKSYKFGPLVWGTSCNLISQVYVFLFTRPLVHHKNKSNSLDNRLWKRYFTPNSTVKLLRQNIRVWPWNLKWNISWQIGFYYLFVSINQ